MIALLAVGPTASFDAIWRRFLAKFCRGGRWHDNAVVQRWQHVRVFDQNQVPQRARVRDDDHSGCLSELWSCPEILLVLVSEPRTRFVLTLKALERVLEPHAVVLQEAIELVAGRNAK